VDAYRVENAPRSSRWDVLVATDTARSSGSRPFVWCARLQARSPRWPGISGSHPETLRLWVREMPMERDIPQRPPPSSPSRASDLRVHRCGEGALSGARPVSRPRGRFEWVLRGPAASPVGALVARPRRRYRVTTGSAHQAPMAPNALASVVAAAAQSGLGGGTSRRCGRRRSGCNWRCCSTSPHAASWAGRRPPPGARARDQAALQQHGKSGACTPRSAIAVRPTLQPVSSSSL
jgi:hypothetical protein